MYRDPFHSPVSEEFKRGRPRALKDVASAMYNIFYRFPCWAGEELRGSSTVK